MCHHEKDQDFNEYWEFDCGACIVLDGEWLEANDECGSTTPPLEAVVRSINAERKTALAETR